MTVVVKNEYDTFHDCGVTESVNLQICIRKGRKITFRAAAQNVISTALKKKRACFKGPKLKRSCFK